MKFKELENIKQSERENKIIDFWKNDKILEKSINNREKEFVFYDGPATANGHPGLHHMVAKFLKDSFCKYKTMTGHKVLRKIGWDTHGLPVEVQVEKELGFSSKTEIENYGIEKFNQKCKESVWKNEESFNNLTTKMGQLIDQDNPYVTYHNSYIESEWHILKRFHEEGLFYRGAKILPYCSRCGTGLASHEVAQGYKEVSVDTLTVTFKKKDEDVYFLVWTTTPWTLISNVALCVNPDETYVKAESMGHTFIVAKKLMKSVLGEDANIIEEYKGKDLEGTEYEQLIPSLKVDKKAFFVTCDNYVTMEDGTGIVHIAPAFGQDDANIGKKYNLPYLNPVGEDGKYKEGMWKGINVFDADLEVIKYLKSEDKIFKKQKIMHNYPHCWRCDTPLIYYSKPSYYLEVTKLKDKIIDANKTIKWHPSYVGEKRFGNWLENLNDWAISRNRYWGTPLPYWTCECGHNEMIGSVEELREKAIEEVNKDIDLHRPYVDNIHLKCSKCDKPMTRTTDVIDCWFDSGAMPFAQYHYPFENKELWESQFPADFISEGIDQTRGWFYSLLVIGVFMTGKAPYKNVLVNDLLLDSNGKKMSKSKGNIVEPFSTMEEYGADTVRFYLPYVSPVWTPLKFSKDGLKEVHSKFFNPLNNTYNFFAIYANADNIDPREYEVKDSDYELIDKWLYSKYNKLIKYVTQAYEEYDLNKVVKSLTEFVSEDLSNWYIRRNRNRFWGSELTNNKKAVYKTTYDILLGISKLVAPIASFTAEEIYKNLTDKESVHLSDFPTCDNKLINEDIETKMDLVRDLISMGRNVREEVKIKVRQPITSIILDSKNKETIGDLTSLIYEELNIKDIIFESDLSKYMNYTVKPNFKVVGPILGKDIKDYSNFLNNLSEEEIKDISNGKIIKYKDIDINTDMVEIKLNAIEGYNATSNNNEFIILDTTLTEELLQEGNAREFVSKIQNLRKESGFNIVDRINVYYEENTELETIISKFKEYISKEILAKKIEKINECNTELKINDLTIKVIIEKI